MLLSAIPKAFLLADLQALGMLWPQQPLPVSGGCSYSMPRSVSFRDGPLPWLYQKAPADRRLTCHALPVQTAHDPQYLVKHLLSDLPAVTERVKAMRQARGGSNVEDNKNRMFASQEAYLKVC